MKPRALWRIDGDSLYLDLHPGQATTWRSDARFTYMLSGKQGGKTSFAPWWLWREIQHPERGGSGDYIAATSTYDLFKLKMLPELRICFEQILGVGRYWSGDRIIELRDPDTGRFWAKRADDPMWGRVVLRSAQASGGLEAATAKAAWLDECVAPETLVSTEHGDIPIARIVQERMRVRVWSYDTEQNKWELRPITKWVCLPQHQELVQLGDLWLTANHRIWTRDDGYMPIAHFCHSCYNVVSGGQKHYDKVHAMQCRVDGTTKKVLQPQMLSGVECISAGVCRGYVSEAQAVFCRSSRGERENLTETEVTLCGSCQSALASGRRRTDDAFSKIKANAFRTDAGTTDLEKRGKRQSPQLATREVGSGAWLGQRICGSDRQRMVAACLQNRRCRVGSEDCHRGWKCGQPTQAGLVHTEWVDVSSLLKSDGGNLDGRCSADGCVYNLGIERNHNYIANGILVSNCGQDEFTLEAKDAVEARLALHQGRMLATTSLFNVGWLKDEYDAWANGAPDVEFVTFSSVVNPSFSTQEFERLRGKLPDWRFSLWYLAQFVRPAGLIYNAFTDSMLVDPFPIPLHWVRAVGVDFGGANNAIVYAAEDPNTEIWYVYAEWLGGGLSSAEYAERAHEGLFGARDWTAWGGAPSEDQARRDWTAGGFKVLENPIPALEPGITNVIGYLKTNRIRVFRSCRGLRDELGSYRRKVDESGQPTEEIIDKRKYHRLDGLRYLFAGVENPTERKTVGSMRQ